MAKRKKKDYNSTVLIVNSGTHGPTFYDKDTSRTTERTRDWLRRMTWPAAGSKNK